jgi:hypothetical protein
MAGMAEISFVLIIWCICCIITFEEGGMRAGGMGVWRMQDMRVPAGLGIIIVDAQGGGEALQQMGPARVQGRSQLIVVCRQPQRSRLHRTAQSLQQTSPFADAPYPILPKV